MMKRLLSAIAITCASLAATLPTALPASAFEIEPVTSSAGIEAWLVSEDTVPVIALEVLFHAGSHLDPEGKAGLASMTTALMTQGAGELDSQAFAARLRDINVSLSVSASRDTVQVRMKSLAKNTTEAFELVKLALTQPRFDEEDVARVRAQTLVSLARDEEDPDTVAYRTFFGETLAGHPYATPPIGTVESVATITVQDMRDYAAMAFARDNVSISVVGAISAEELKPLLDSTFSTLPEVTQRADTAEVAPLEPGVTVVERDNPQTVVVFGMDGLARDDEDFIPAYVMNYVLGGGSFVSRMFKQVREERGLAYTAYTSLYPLAHGGLTIGYLASSNATAGEALDVAKAQVVDIAQNGITADELEAAKTFLTGSYALRFDSSRAIAGQLAAIQFEDLGLDYIDKRNGLIEAVTLDDIARVSKRILKPDAMRVVAVGSPAGIPADESAGDEMPAATHQAGQEVVPDTASDAPMATPAN